MIEYWGFSHGAMRLGVRGFFVLAMPNMVAIPALVRMFSYYIFENENKQLQ